MDPLVQVDSAEDDDDDAEAEEEDDEEEDGRGDASEALDDPRLREGAAAPAEADADAFGSSRTGCSVPWRRPQCSSP